MGRPKVLTVTGHATITPEELRPDCGGQGRAVKPVVFSNGEDWELAIEELAAADTEQGFMVLV